MHTRTGQLRAGWVAGVLAFGTATASAATALEPVLPWAEGEAGQVEESSSGGRLRYVWPPVRDEYVETAPLPEVARWVHRQWSAKANAVHFERARRSGGPAGDVIAIVAEPAPLLAEQWETLAARAAEAWRSGDPERERGAMDMIGVIDMLEQEHFGDGSPACRAIAEEALRRCLAPEGKNIRWLPHLASRFSARSGDTGLLRRLAAELRGTAEPARSVRVAEVVAAGSWSEHDLSAAEMVGLGLDMLRQANADGLDRQLRITIGDAALRLGGPVSLRLMDDALGSEHPDVRGVAVRWALQHTRAAQAEGDAKTLEGLLARADRLVAAIDDPNERVAAGAVSAVVVLFEDRPAAWVSVLTAKLGARPPSVDAMACMHLMEAPQLAAGQLDTLRKLAASSDPDLRSYATELVRAIEAAEN